MKEQNKDGEQKGITNLPGAPRSITRIQMSEAGLEYNNKRNQNVRKRFAVCKYNNRGDPTQCRET